jgi:hypothetical protein
MPTIFRWLGFRLHFYSDEGHEPPHVHVRRDEDSCKFWLQPVALAYTDGVREHELTQLREVVEEHREEFLRKWHEYFG